MSSPVMERDPAGTAPGQPRAHAHDTKHGGRGWVPQGRGWVALLVVVLVCAVGGVVLWRDIVHEVSQGPGLYIGASGTLQPGQMTYRYATFSGLAREQTTLTAGQVLALRWSAQVTKGSLDIAVKDAQGRDLWRVNLPTGQTRQGTEHIRAPSAGRYQVVVVGLETGGNYDVSWPVP